ncbi:uncharacterized protein F5147DRAFT_649830 [Suillus discolor]|uniref:Uncharacterized protein n=1 Tax=Suillus discolor TaxID=1912936 RepID=A0A9P7FFM6_9AGAM|nr:uncharacterized protein F5147DRAFT_649830 [Suillus discolor]KAG2114666.1 hypothetical protein F5147DRAFT_649830 [Suillus discolor]
MSSESTTYCGDRALAAPTVAVQPLLSGPLNAATPASPSQSKKVHVSESAIPLPVGKAVQSISRSTRTPRAIGALPKHIPPKVGGLMQHLIIPNISESCHSIAAYMSAFQPSKDCDDSDTNTTGDESTDSTEEARARLVLEASRAQRDVRLAEKRLADSIIKENDALGRLYKFQAGEVQKQLLDANVSIGYTRHSICKSDEPSVASTAMLNSSMFESEPTYDSEAAVDI